MDLPAPKNWLEMARDKYWKLTAIAVESRKILEKQKNPEDGIYVMPIDADDLLNNKIVGYCEEHPNENCFVSKDGYVWYSQESKLRIYKHLYEFCESCNVIKMYREDLPEKMPYDDLYCHDGEIAKILNKRYPIRLDHNEVVKKYAEIKKPFEELPFCSTIYVLETGDNISSIYKKEHSNDNNKERFHPVAFIKNIYTTRIFTKSIKDEFGLL